MIYVSPSVEQLLGFAPEEVLHQPLAELVSPRSADLLMKAFPERFEKFHEKKDAKYFEEIELLTQDGSIVLAETSMRAFVNAKNQHIEVYGVSRDITWRKKAEEALKQSEEILRATQKISKVGGWEWNIEQQVMYWTDEVYRIHDMEPGDISGEAQEHIDRSLDCYDLPGRQMVYEAFLNCVEEGVPYDLQMPFTTVQGRKIWIRTTAQAEWRDGKIVKVIGNIMDVTERKQAEVALRESESTLQKIFEILPIGLWFADKNGKLIKGNAKGIEIWGVEPTVGMSEYGIFKARRLPSGEEIAPEDWALAHTIREGVTITDEMLEIETFDGKKKIILNYTAPVIGDDGQVLGAVVVNLDITNSKRMEKALEEERNSLARRVAERTADLRRSNASLERALAAKDEFLANMSHELRTPLTAILGLAELLEMGVYGPLTERQQKYVTTIHSSGQHLLELINDILDLAKTGAGKLDLQLETVLVSDVCQSSLAFIRTMAEKKNIQVHSSISAPDLKIQADGRRLRQILVNLLSNAVKFTGEDGRVALDVTADAEAQVVHFCVSDTGIGIAKQDMGRLFQPFTQLDTGLDRQYEGSGLGLALVYRLVDLHQGSVSVESEGIAGQGSKFTVSLPWGMEIELPEEGLSRTSGVEAELTPQAQAAQQNQGVILLVEDNESNIMTISEYLIKLGFQVVEARNGREALELAAQYIPDLILMDIYMPVMDGLEATRSLRKNERFATIPILAVTALAMPGDRDRCLEAGADDFLTKPVSLKNLYEKIKSFLGSD
jgi:PAS domain S-box-containing protein